MKKLEIRFEPMFGSKKSYVVYFDGSCHGLFKTQEEAEKSCAEIIEFYYKPENQPKTIKTWEL